MSSKIALRCYLEDRSFVLKNDFAINHHHFNICNNVKKFNVVVVYDIIKLDLTEVKISLHEKLLD